MGDNTEFRGVLEFTTDLTTKELSYLTQFLGADCREHPEWPSPEGLTFIDLRLTKDFLGLEWNSDTEKTYGMVEAINFIIARMKTIMPNFGLKGEMFAQGEEFGDIWKIVFKDGVAKKVNIPLEDEEIKCPFCKRKFKKDQ